MDEEIPDGEKKKGRPLGSKGRTLVRARGMINDLVERRAEVVEKWLDDVYEQDGPKEALKLFIDLCEFVLPKLARVEQSGIDGAPIEKNVNVRYIDPQSVPVPPGTETL